MFGIVPMKSGEAAPMLSNFTDRGGLFPNGFFPILMTMLSVNFAFSGTELIGIAAGESADPEKPFRAPLRPQSGGWRFSLSERFLCCQG